MVQHRALSVLALAPAFAGATLAHELRATDVDREEIWQGDGFRRAEQGALAPDGPFPAAGVELASWLPLNTLWVGEPPRARAPSACGLALTRSESGARYAWIGLSTGLACVDVSAPDSARRRFSLELEASTARAFAAANGLLCTLDARGVLRLFDVSKPEVGSAERLAELETGAAGHPALALDASRSRVLVAGGRAGLAIYDVADPRAPALVARWNARYVDSLAPAPDGSARVACATGFNDGWTRAGVELLDLADPKAPRPLGRVEWSSGVPHVAAWAAGEPGILALAEADAARLGELETRLAAVAVDAASRPRRADRADASIGVAQHAAPFGPRVAVASCRRGLRVLDASAWTELAWFDTVPKDDAPRLSGLWEVAPLDDRTLVGVDLEKGLFVWHVPQIDAAEENAER